MSRNRSSSLPGPATATTDGSALHLRDGSVIRSPLAIARSISADSDAPGPPLVKPIDSKAELGPMLQRSVSDPTSALRISRKPLVGKHKETWNGSRDEDASWSHETTADDSWDAVRRKDEMRRCHALKELLATEFGYLQDLRSLVTVRYFSYHF